MVSAKASVINPQGLHMRPAQLFVREMNKFECDVTVVSGGSTASGKSAMDLMAARIRRGSEIEIRCDGPQEEDALAAALRLVEAGLGDI